MSTQLFSSTQHFPPGPKGHLIFGHLSEINRAPLDFFTQCAREYGDFVRLRFGPFPVYLLNHPDLVKEVLVTQSPKFIKSSAYRRGLRVLGNGLLTSDGNFWKRQRRLVQPAFHHEVISSCAELMVEYTNQLIGKWQDGEVCDIHHEMMKLTAMIAAKTFFDFDIAGETEGLQDALHTVTDFNARLLNQYLLPTWVPTFGNLSYQRAINQLDTIIYRIIDQRRAGINNKADLLSLLLQLKDEEDGTQMTNKQLRDEVMTLFLAGHATTANALTWMWLLLSQHPNVVEKLQQELKTVLNGQTPTFADFPKLRYATQIIQESMRLYPPVWGISREVLQDCEIGGYHLRAGATVFLNQWVIQRDSRFFDNPEKFDPDRWTDKQLDRLTNYAYFPFGGGQRLCIGKDFAMMETVLLLATIASKFRLILQSDHPVVLHASLSLRPKHGIKMLVAQQQNTVKV